MARARWVMLGLAALAATFWLGTRLGAPASERSGGGRVERVVVERASGPPIVMQPAGGLTREDIRAVVREELAQHEHAEAKPGDARAADAASPERAAKVQAAVTAAHEVVTDGVARRVWGDRERAALRVQLVQLGPAETREVLTPLFQAINTQQLQLDGPPI
jgi:hypothetical protein